MDLWSAIGFNLSGTAADESEKKPKSAPTAGHLAVWNDDLSGIAGQITAECLDLSNKDAVESEKCRNQSRLLDI